MTALLPFSVTHEDRTTRARAASLTTPHGVVETPAFMPVGTSGTVKGITGWELGRLGPQMVLSNTYHLVLRPGVQRLIRLGGIHRVMGWEGPILTDSGGYQVFSLAARRALDEDGVVFQSHLDGSSHFFSPESVVDAQADFGVDVAMVLDECLPFPIDRASIGPSVDRTLRWARRALARAVERREAGGWAGGLFAVQQGSVDLDIRRRCSGQLASMAFDGYAIGGLAVGEPTEVLHESVDFCAPMLPVDRPRYLMGVGYPEDLLHAVACGVDLFDCVLPTRSARTGKIFTSQGELAIKNARWADDDTPLDPDCSCPTCARYSKGALRHFFVAKEATSVVLLTIHNLHYFLSLMRGAREAIMTGRYGEYRERCQSTRKMGPGECAPRR